MLLDCPYVVSVATDTPFLPVDLVARLAEGLDEAGADLSCAASGGRSHPVFGLWPVRLREDLRREKFENRGGSLDQRSLGQAAQQRVDHLLTQVLCVNTNVERNYHVVRMACGRSGALR
jgi:molybdopterin-guanine dinucleotide biosynthesis protein A